MEREISPFYYFSLRVRPRERARDKKKKQQRAKFINKTRKKLVASPFYFFYSHSHTTTGAGEREKNRRRCWAGRARESGRIDLVKYFYCPCQVIILWPCSWHHAAGSGAKEAASSPPRARTFFHIKNNLILAARGKHTHTTQKTSRRRK